MVEFIDYSFNLNILKDLITDLLQTASNSSFNKNSELKLAKVDCLQQLISIGLFKKTNHHLSHKHQAQAHMPTMLLSWALLRDKTQRTLVLCSSLDSTWQAACFYASFKSYNFLLLNIPSTLFDCNFYHSWPDNEDTGYTQ